MRLTEKVKIEIYHRSALKRERTISQVDSCRGRTDSVEAYKDCATLASLGKDGIISPSLKTNMAKPRVVVY